jgi:alkaline phosphatase
LLELSVTRASLFLAAALAALSATPSLPRPSPPPSRPRRSPTQRPRPLLPGRPGALAKALAVNPRTGKAKNVILFLGDGMGISTMVASRIYEGQQRGVDGESNSLSFEKLPWTALSKTYSHDTQVTDSAAGITAITTGVKTRNKVIGLSGAAKPEVCATEAGTRVETIAELAKAHGLSAGAVTTTRITHATPAGVYAHTAYRDWEGDGDMPTDALAGGLQGHRPPDGRGGPACAWTWRSGEGARASCPRPRTASAPTAVT